MNKILRYYFTIQYLQPIQIYYRIKYFIRKKFLYTISTKLLKVSSKTYHLAFKQTLNSAKSFDRNNFEFLNLTHSFENEIDWNFSDYGKLWTYNLTYFDYLQQKEMKKEAGLLLIRDFIDQGEDIKDGFMPFPISVRGINWIKFLSTHKIQDQKINDSLYAQYFILIDSIEYHILGNHLLENAFSLLFGAYYFQDEKFYIKAKEILRGELEEQILKDGAHFELSPMYHQIMLFRILDSINLVQNNNWKNHELLGLLISKAEMMFGWLNTITYENGDIPLLNDSTNNISPTTKELNVYASALKVKTEKVELNDSGYRKIKNGYYEMIVDVGNIGPDYIPGHAHSDTFNFELYIGNKPFIVDTGLSTYETNARRTLERSTLSHNTVEIDGLNQSEVWGGFRVAKRAKIIHIKETKNTIEATHDGYKDIGVLHTRKFTMYERSIIIEDTIDGSGQHQCVAHLHFHPKVKPKIKGKTVTIEQVEIILHNATSLEIKEYQHASEFNNLTNAFNVRVWFIKNLKMEIKI